jgi:hypothetical protein
MTLHVLSWTRIAPVLGLSETGSVLPVGTTCPFCQGKMSIYQDTKSGEEWAYCSDCRYSSSVLDMAAKIWDIPLSIAIERLSEATSISVTPEQINRYIKREVIPREKANRLWRKSQKNLFKPDQKLGRLRTRLGLRSPLLSPERVGQGPSTLFGVSHVEEIKNIWEPQRQGRRKTNAFKGRHWADVLVIPYFKAPSDVSSLLFIGRTGRPAQDHVFQTYARRNAQHASVGFAGLPSVIDYVTDHVICMSDTLAMLRIQMRHFNTSLQPLPIIGWRPDDKYRLSHNWHLFNGKKLIFWDWAPSASLLHQCMVTGGRLTLNVGPRKTDHRGISHWVRDFKTMYDVQRLVRRNAKKWEVSLYNWYRHKDTTDEQVARLLDRCSLLDHRLFQKVCVALKLKGDSRHYTHTTSVGKHSYTERNGIWYRGDKEVPILPGYIEVYKIITRESKPPEYIGEIVLPAEAIPFRISGESQSRLNRTLYDLIEFNGHFCEKPDTRNRAGLIQIALAFRAPEIVRGKNAIGWDGEAYQFKNFCLRRGASEMTLHMLPESVGGPQRVRYGWRTEVADKLRNATNNESVWTWSAIFSFGAQVVASMFGRTIPWISFEHASNCDTTFIEMMDRLEVPITDDFWKHSWPVVSVKHPHRRQRFRATITSEGEEIKNTYAVIPPAHKKEFAPKDIPLAFRVVLPDFMKWVTANVDESTFNDTDHWQLQILALFRRWGVYRELEELFPVFKEAAKGLKYHPNPEEASQEFLL